MTNITLPEFTDYVVSKGLDVIGGDFKRYLYKCVENQDEWALRIHASIAKVNAAVREVQTLVEWVRQTDSALARVCKEVVTAMHAPIRKVHTLQVCCLTNAYSTSCIDVSRATKTDSPVIVHARFEYFVVMLYYVHRFEHVVRCMAKSWVAQHDGHGEDLSTLAERWQSESVLFESMWQRFQQGWAHVHKSLEEWLVQNKV
jgi:hypothetical protein